MDNASKRHIQIFERWLMNYIIRDRVLPSSVNYVLIYTMCSAYTEWLCLHQRIAHWLKHNMYWYSVPESSYASIAHPSDCSTHTAEPPAAAASFHCRQRSCKNPYPLPLLAICLYPLLWHPAEAGLQLHDSLTAKAQVFGKNEIRKTVWIWNLGLL